MNADQARISNIILSGLMTEDFGDFYDGELGEPTADGIFIDFVTGEENALSRDEILEKIVKIFKL